MSEKRTSAGSFFRFLLSISQKLSAIMDVIFKPLDEMLQKDQLHLSNCDKEDCPTCTEIRLRHKQLPFPGDWNENF